MQPLRRPPTEHEDAISGEDDFEDVESENEEKPKEQPTITKPISKEPEPSKSPSSHNDDEIEGDDNFSSDQIIYILFQLFSSVIQLLYKRKNINFIK